MNKKQWAQSLCKRQTVKGKNQSEVNQLAMMQILNLIDKDLSPKVGIFSIIKDKR